MKVILAQGNPGTEFTRTRHNVGFMALDHYVDQKGLKFVSKQKMFADIAEIGGGEDKVLLVKPTTFYNETGRSARAIADFYKVPTDNFLVIHDDLSLPFGTIRTREKGRDAGNNGIKSLNASLGENYMRIRVGTRNDLTEKIGDHDFVLSSFSSTEREKAESDILPKIVELIDDFVGDNHSITSHRI